MGSDETLKPRLSQKPSPKYFQKINGDLISSLKFKYGISFSLLHLSFQHHTFSLRHRTVAMPAIISTGTETFAQRSEATSLWLLAHVLHRELFILPLNYLSYTHRMEIISSERKGVDVTCVSDPAA